MLIKKIREIIQNLPDSANSHLSSSASHLVTSVINEQGGENDSDDHIVQQQPAAASTVPSLSVMCWPLSRRITELVFSL